MFAYSESTSQPFFFLIFFVELTFKKVLEADATPRRRQAQGNAHQEGEEEQERENDISNVAGYFVTVLKGDWASKQVVESEEKEIDQGAVSRHWYDLARELGYCSGQEVREGEQWVNLSGAWEKWADAVKRGYSLEYLKKIMKRNRG